jgi:hypothetical protein
MEGRAAADRPVSSVRRTNRRRVSGACSIGGGHQKQGKGFEKCGGLRIAPAARDRGLCEETEEAVVIRSETGFSSNYYLQRFRIESAKQLLLLGEGSIPDIAMAIGFTSSQYFSRVFPRYCGSTPQQFRRQRRGAE